MSLVNNKKAIGLPFVLGIITFVLALVATLFSVAVNQAQMITKSQRNLENYENNVHSILTAMDIIKDDSTILTDSSKRPLLSEMLHISITSQGSYWIFQNEIGIENPLTSYLEITSSNTVTTRIFVENEIKELNGSNSVITTPQDVYLNSVTNFYNDFIGANAITASSNAFVDINQDSENRTPYRITDTPLYTAPNRSSNIYLRKGSLTISGSFSMPNNKILIVTGDLIISQYWSFTGTAIVTGKVVAKKFSRISGVIYTPLFEYGRATLGTSSNPLFIFTNTFTSTDNGFRGNSNLYLFTNTATAPKNGLKVIGSIFSPDPNLVNFQITPRINRYIDYEDLPEVLFDSAGSGTGTVIINTYPR
jgi:hypothetical protein